MSENEKIYDALSGLAAASLLSKAGVKDPELLKLGAETGKVLSKHARSKTKKSSEKGKIKKKSSHKKHTKHDESSESESEDDQKKKTHKKHHKRYDSSESEESSESD